MRSQASQAGVAEKSVDTVPLGARLRSERDRLGLNQTEFGKLGGVNRSSQTEYELGKRPFSIAYLLGLAAGGVDCAFVLTGLRTSGDLTIEQTEWLSLIDQLEDDERDAILQMVRVMLARRRPPSTVHSPARDYRGEAGDGR